MFDVPFMTYQKQKTLILKKNPNSSLKHSLRKSQEVQKNAKYKIRRTFAEKILQITMICIEEKED